MTTDLLTINFTTRGLESTQFDKRALSNIGRRTIVNIDQQLSDDAFLPKSSEVFVEFLNDNLENQLMFGYKVDCGNQVIWGQIQWMLDRNAKQIKLYCSNGKTIFDNHIFVNTAFPLNL